MALSSTPYVAQWNVELVERHTFLEFRCEVPIKCGLSRSSSDPGFKYQECVLDVRGKLEEDGGDDELCGTSAGRDDDATESLCSWSTDSEEDLPNLRNHAYPTALPEAVGFDESIARWGGMHADGFAWHLEACPRVVHPVLGCCFVPVAAPVMMLAGAAPTKTALPKRTKKTVANARFGSTKVNPIAAIADDLESEWTTTIFRNVPGDCARDTLTGLLNQEGFRGSYDFVHVPVSFQTFESLGYAVVNFVDHAAAERAMIHFHGFAMTTSTCSMDHAAAAMTTSTCSMDWNRPNQGLASHIERYRNSPMMHKLVPQEYQPALYVDGQLSQFPGPTQRVKPPRVRHPKCIDARCRRDSSPVNINGLLSRPTLV